MIGQTISAEVGWPGSAIALKVAYASALQASPGDVGPRHSTVSDACALASGTFGSSFHRRCTSLACIRLGSPDQYRSPDLESPDCRSPDLGAWARMPRPPKHCIYPQGHALSCLFTFQGVNVPPGVQCASCSRRTSALEAVQLSAIPVKRTAAASDELCSFEVSCLGSS